MADIPTKYALLKKLLFLMGIKNINDYTTRVFNANLKQNSTFCNEVGTLMNDMTLTADSAVKLAKDLMDSCGVSYNCGRTSKSTFFCLCESPEKDTAEYIKLNDGLMYKLPMSETAECARWTRLLALKSGIGDNYTSHYYYLEPDTKKSTAGRLVFEHRYDYIDEVGVIMKSFQFVNDTDADRFLLVKNVHTESLKYQNCGTECLSDDLFMHYKVQQDDSNVVRLSVGAENALVLEYDVSLTDKIKYITVMGRCIDFQHEARKNQQWIKQINPLVGQETMTYFKPEIKDAWTSLDGFDYIKAIHFKEIPSRIELAINNGKQIFDTSLIHLMKVSDDQSNCPQGYKLSWHFYHESLGGMQAFVTAAIDHVKFLAIDEYGKHVEFLVESFDHAAKRLLARTPEDYVREIHKGAVIIEQQKLQIPCVLLPPTPIRCKKLFYLLENYKSESITSDYVPPILNFLNLKIKHRTFISKYMFQYELALNKEIVWISSYYDQKDNLDGFFFYEPETRTLEEQLIDAVKNGFIQEFDDCVNKFPQQRFPNSIMLLDLAIEHGQKDMFHYLIKKNYSTKVFDHDFQSILNTVARFGKIDLLNDLIKHKPDEFDFTQPNQETYPQRNWNSLNYAEAGEHHDMITALIRLGVPRIPPEIDTM